MAPHRVAQGSSVPALCHNHEISTSRLLEAVSSWCEAMHGALGLDQALAEIASASGASAAMLVRTRVIDGHESPIAVYDQDDGSNRRVPLRTAYADQIFGRYLERARSATVWIQSTCDPVHDEALLCFQALRGLQDFCVIVLGRGPVERDHIELHFADQIGPQLDALFATITPVVARNWAGRETGVVSKAAGRRSRSAVQDLRKPGGLLDIDNPAHLSRCEYRVCLLLARGLSVRGVCVELGVTDATVRSHLRNIYAKTETTCLTELVYLLMSDRQRPKATYARSA